MSRELGTARREIVSSFSNPNPESVGIFKALEDIYPAFSRKIFHNNAFMQMIVMSNYSPMHILEYPICGRCETLAMWDNTGMKDGRLVKACSCFATGCGARTLAPITFREWLKQEIRHKAPKDIVENIEYAVDAIALSLMKRSLLEQKELMQQESGTRMSKLGLVDQYGEAIPQEHYEVTMTEASSPVDLDEEARKIGKEEGLDYERIE